MLMRWSLGRTDVAEAIEAAVTVALDAGYRTPDLVAAVGEEPGTKKVGTQAMGDAVVAALSHERVAAEGGERAGTLTGGRR